VNYDSARKGLASLAQHELLPIDYASEDPYLIREIGGSHPKSRPMRVCVPIGLCAGIDTDCQGPGSFIKQGFGYIEIGPVSINPRSGIKTEKIQVLPRAVVADPDRFDGSLGLVVVANRLCDYLDSRINDPLSRNSVTGLSIITESPEDVEKIFDHERLIATADFLSLDVRSVKDETELISIIERVNNACKSAPSIPQILIQVSLSQSFPPIDRLASLIRDSPFISGINLVGQGVVSSTGPDGKEKFSNFSGDSPKDLVIDGDIVREKAAQGVANWYRTLGGKTIIASGGVVCGKDALNLIESGASMVSIYSAFICDGPQVGRQIKTQLSVQLMNKGYFNLEETIGSNHRLQSKRMVEVMKRRKRF